MRPIELNEQGQIDASDRLDPDNGEVLVALTTQDILDIKSALKAGEIAAKKLIFNVAHDHDVGPVLLDYEKPQRMDALHKAFSSVVQVESRLS